MPSHVSGNRHTNFSPAWRAHEHPSALLSKTQESLNNTDAFNNLYATEPLWKSGIQWRICSILLEEKKKKKSNVR